MVPRFFVPDLDPRQSEAVLPEAEAHHLHRVMRLGIDDEIIVFDGRGIGFTARVRSIERGVVTVRLGDALDAAPVAEVTLTLVQAILKGDAMEGVVRDCTMVGIHSLQPMATERTSVKLSALPKAVERWRRVALASAKQCGRLHLPDIHEVTSVDEWMRRPQPDHAFLLVEPSAIVEGTISVRELARRPVPASATLVVGPEGGWTPRERDLALASGCTPLTLGRLTLRADAVALAASAALLAIWTNAS